MMRPPTPSERAIGAAVANLVITVLGLTLLVANRYVVYGNDFLLWGMFTATAAVYSVSGVAIVRRAPAHAVGWLCLAIAGVLQLGLTLTQYGIFTLRTHPGSLPLPGLALVVAETTPLLTLTGIVLILHLFPTGRPLSRRWGALVGVSIAGQALALVHEVVPHRITDVWSDELSHAGVAARDPIGIPALAHASNMVPAAAGTLIALGAAGAVASLFVRRRRATPEERRQIRWLGAVTGSAAGWIVLMLPIMILTGPNGPAGAAFWLVATPLVALGPPAAIGIGIVRYRLFDIDVVIRKTVVVTVVAVTLTGLYLAVLALATVGRVSRIVVGIALLAVTFNPVRRAARAIADRVAYGRRASSYEVLSDFSARIAETYATEDVLERIASILATGTGARSATVWLRVGGVLRPEAIGGEPIDARPVASSGDRLPPLEGTAIEVRHRGELLGALSVVMPPSDPIDDARRRLIRDMASQAGLVLRNVRLIEELRASRQRLVAAQDDERRKIERNIHDGAQQQLVALGVQLGLLERQIDADPGAAKAAASRLKVDTTSALEDLRALARGIYPPLLADEGLGAALAAQARRSPLPVSVEPDGVGRYGQDVEAAVYFCVLEALQNVAKYANASSAVVRLSAEGGDLRFEILDDGVGFDPATARGSGVTNMRDRLESLGGSLDLDTGPGRGTKVVGRIPVIDRSAPG